MSIILLNTGPSKVITKQIEVVKLNNKYYIELDEFESSDSILELSIALSQQNESLREHIAILQEKLSIYDSLPK